VLDRRDAIVAIDAAPVISVHEEGRFGAGGSELIGDVAKIDVWTCASRMAEGKIKKSRVIPSSWENMSENQTI
jgi:hypothetical protein